jgi:hypothetical protein
MPDRPPLRVKVVADPKVTPGNLAAALARLLLDRARRAVGEVPKEKR